MEDNKLKIIGITGGVGAGKSTVAKLYADIKGAYIIFTDNVAKYLQEEGKTCYNLIVEHFGQEILNDDRSIDRAKLAQIVFGNEEELKILNSYVHKQVLVEVKRIIEDIRLKGTYTIILLESAILFQVNELKDLCDEIWYVEARETDRRERLKRERGYSEERIEAMSISQECIRRMKDRCDRVIINDRDIMELDNSLYSL